MIRALLNSLPKLWSNPITLLGTVLTTVTGCALLLLFGLDVSGLTMNPYSGILLLVGLPALFVLSTAVIVINQVISQPMESVTGLLLVLSGLPVYFFWARRGQPTSNTESAS